MVILESEDTKYWKKIRFKGEDIASLAKDISVEEGEIKKEAISDLKDVIDDLNMEQDNLSKKLKEVV